MKLSHIGEAALNQQMSSQRCHPHMAPIDTVGPNGPHPRVLKELNSVIAPTLCGISELSYSLVTLYLAWIQDVLNDRKQCVILEAEKSGFINVGPILFLAFINGGLTKLQTGQKAKLV